MTDFDFEGLKKLSAGEQFGLLKNEIPKRISAMELEVAEQLSDHLMVIAKECLMDSFWNQYAYIFKARIALRKNTRYKRYLNKLNKMLPKLALELNISNHISTSVSMRGLLQDLQTLGTTCELETLLNSCFEACLSDLEYEPIVAQWLDEVRTNGSSKFENMSGEPS